MKKLLVSTLSVPAAAVAVLLVACAARAADGTSTISVNAADCDNCLAMGYPCGDPACTTVPVYTILVASSKVGAIPSLNWNNLLFSAGALPNLIEDIDGVAIVTDAEARWEATNTWSTTGRGEENNTFTGDNRTLMTGYLDQNTPTPSPTFLQIQNIPDDIAANYDVIVYTLGAVPDRGGEYAVNGGVTVGVDLKFVVASATIHGDTVFNGPDFVEAIGDDPGFGTNDWGNYVVFRGLSGKTVTITATNTFGDVPRAPINGIQLVAR